MAFINQILTDFKNILSTGEFSEAITYTPSGGSPKSLSAVIVRERTDAKGPDHHISLQQGCEIYIANDAVAGVTSINKNNDAVNFPVQKGGTPLDWRVVEIIYHDDALWHLRLTK